MTRIKLFFAHRLNPLHVYCRLCDIGLGADSARWVSGAYERWIFNKFKI